MTSAAEDHGLARERTGLGWTRTALGVAINGVLVAIRHDQSLGFARSSLVLSLAGLVAITTWVTGTHRNNVIRASRGTLPPARGPVMILGAGVALLCLAWIAIVVGLMAS